PQRRRVETRRGTQECVRHVSLVACLALLAIAGTPPATAKNVALVIGNQSYAPGPLKSPAGDARLVERALRDAGFATILRENAGQAELLAAESEFVNRLEPVDTALVFFAGYAVAVEDENFLLGVDSGAGNIQAKAVPLSEILERLRGRAARSVVILDASRMYIVAAQRGLKPGLAMPRNLPPETWMAFAAGPGQVAPDNLRLDNSSFSKALAETIAQPGLTLEEVFSRTRARVLGETESQQAPWWTSTGTRNFYFHPPEGPQPRTDAAASARSMETARQSERREDWDTAIDLLIRVLKSAPGGETESVARHMLPYLMERRDGDLRYRVMDFNGAAMFYGQAVAAQPSAVDAAFRLADAYLLAGRVPDAIRVLQAVRARGPSPAAEKAAAMLEKLAAVR
ncbi:MAG: caspase family protein, partial [Bryobacteraceae bacterium]